MSYIIKYGDGILDAVLNSTGDISAWGDFLDANNLGDWTPSLYSGEILQSPPVISAPTVAALQPYPASNLSVNDVYDKIDALFYTLTQSTPSPAPIPIPPGINLTPIHYDVGYSDTITDAVFNGTGNIDKWSDVLNDNDFNTWTPDLYAGQILKFAHTTGININVKRVLTTYPSNNHSVNDVYEQINIIFDLLNNPTADWILYNPDGFWNDINHYWRDGAFWLD